MAVSLSGLPGILHFDVVGEAATLAQRRQKWRDEFELFVTASGLAADKQRRTLLLHLAGPGVQEIFKIFLPDLVGEKKATRRPRIPYPVTSSSGKMCQWQGRHFWQ